VLVFGVGSVLRPNGQELRRDTIIVVLSPPINQLALTTDLLGKEVQQPARTGWSIGCKSTHQRN
jgi:hypothetical protein